MALLLIYQEKREHLAIIQVINNEDPPLETRHLAWFTRRGEKNTIQLWEVIEAKYPHPDVPDLAFTWIYETHRIDESHISVGKAAAWILLEAAERSITYQQTMTENGC